ncbi:MAG: hypothetical protein M3417_12605, partial [Actinomycetota bacterium]|nr:hypothetical protein [Actinomycetota bacterium]
MSPTRGHPGSAPLRQQLSTAHTKSAFGDVPLIASLAAELASIDDASRTSGHSPFDDDAHPTFRSLVADLRSAHGALGDRLGALVQGAVDDAVALGNYPYQTHPPPWQRLIEATRSLRADLLRGRAVVAGFDDALAAAEAVGDAWGYDRLARTLDDLRAISELQGRGWKTVVDEISQHLTLPEDGPTPPGEFGP